MNPQARASVLDGSKTPRADSETIVSTSTDVPCVAPKITEPRAVPSRDDPRKVVTPLNADGLELLLQEQGIFRKWSHIIDGIC